jgi:hypothetical protein
MTLTLTDKRVFVSGPVKLHGFQAILKPSKFGYSLSALLPEEHEDLLEQDRVESLKWCEAKLTNPKRSTLKPTPWEPAADAPGYLKVKYSWNEETKPYIYDSANEKIDDEGLPLFSDSVVKLAFKQKPYVLRDGVTYGTSLKLVGIQVLSLNRTGVGTDSGDLTDEQIANLFKVSDTTGLDAAEAQQARDAAVEQDPDSEF